MKTQTNPQQKTHGKTTKTIINKDENKTKNKILLSTIDGLQPTHQPPAALLFYVYTNPYNDIHTEIKEIEARKYSAKMEIVKTYFVRCSDVKDRL